MGVLASLVAYFIGVGVGIVNGFGVHNVLLAQASFAFLFGIIGMFSNFLIGEVKRAGILSIFSGLVVLVSLGFFGVLPFIFLLVAGVVEYRSYEFGDNFQSWSEKGKIGFFTSLVLVVLIVGLSFAVYGSNFSPHEDRTDSNPYDIVTMWGSDSDPTSEMIVQWFTEEDEDYSLVLPEENLIFSSSKKDLSSVEGWDSGNYLHRASLEGLEPATEYDFYISSEDGDRSNTYSFMTVSYDDMDEVVVHEAADSRSHWASYGGKFLNWSNFLGRWGEWGSAPSPNIFEELGVDDPSWSKWTGRRRVFLNISERGPHMVLFPGDFILNGFWDSQWESWFDDWSDYVVTDDGRIPPIVPAVGNHETNYSPPDGDSDSYLYYELFPVTGNYTLDFDGMSVITLDSGHSTGDSSASNDEIIRDQTDWLESELQERENSDWLLVQYHVPAYSSYKGIYSGFADVIRDEWSPLFEKHGVDLVAEAHDHTWKYTPPITNAQGDSPFGENMKEDSENTVRYIGDGGAGAPPRPVEQLDNWWIEMAESEFHSWELVFSADNLETRVVFADREDLVNPFVLENF